MKKEDIIRAIIEMRGYKYTHDEMMLMRKKELIEYFKSLKRS